MATQQKENLETFTKDTGQLSQNSVNRRYIQRKQLRGYTPLSYTPVLNGVNHTIYEK